MTSAPPPPSTVARLESSVSTGTSLVDRHQQLPVRQSRLERAIPARPAPDLGARLLLLATRQSAAGQRPRPPRRPRTRCSIAHARESGCAPQLNLLVLVAADTRRPRRRTSRARRRERGRRAPVTRRRCGCSASTSRRPRTRRPHCPRSAPCSASSRARRPAGAARPTRTCGSRSPSRRRRCSPRAATTTRRSRAIGARPVSIRTRSWSSASPARWPGSGNRATRRSGRNSR